MQKCAILATTSLGWRSECELLFQQCRSTIPPGETIHCVGAIQPNLCEVIRAECCLMQSDEAVVAGATVRFAIVHSVDVLAAVGVLWFPDLFYRRVWKPDYCSVAVACWSTSLESACSNSFPFPSSIALESASPSGRLFHIVLKKIIYYAILHCS